MADVTYQNDFPVDAFLALAQRVWPREYSAADAAEALERTINIGAWDGTRLVGSVRVLTDGYFFATIPEILVDPDYQRRGIGRRLMELALDRVPRGKVAFGAQPQSVAFFERIGCRRALTGFVAERPLPPDMTIRQTPPWELWRQDDNGNRVRIATYPSEDVAREALARFESLGHKQIYWIDHPSPTGEQSR
jgi:GNAT superfamily N-acetyltransferase